MATELHDFAMENGWTELEKRVEKMETSRLFEELDDTVQIDLVKATHEEWALMRSQKIVFNAICRELLKRCGHEQ